jgi:hypothetical protein
MFRPYLGPSSGGTTVCIQQFVPIIIFIWLSVVVVGFEQSNQDNRQSSKKNKYQLLYTYGCTSLWLALIRPKHVEFDEIYTKIKLCRKLVFLCKRTVKKYRVWIHKNHILLVHKFLVLSIFIKSYTVFFTCPLLQLILPFYTVHSFFRYF